MWISIKRWSRLSSCISLRSVTSALRHVRKCQSSARTTIGTHNGIFHCDEVLACWLLKQTDRFKDAEIIRTRDKATLAKTEVVVDVGGVYDPYAFRFDHHQPDFDERFENNQDVRGSRVRLSSAGLIYKHFGKEIIYRVLEDLNLSPNDVQVLHRRIYFEMIESVDAKDNGEQLLLAAQGWRWIVGFPVCSLHNGRKGAMNFSDCTDLTSRVSRLNPHWRSAADVKEDEQFRKAMLICAQDFTEFARYLAIKWLPSRQYVLEAIENASNVSSSGEIIVLERGCPWIRFLHELEEEMDIVGKLKFCVYRGDEGYAQYRVHAVPIHLNSNTSRLPLPEEWAGLSGRALERACNIDGSVFVHRNLFLGGHKTKDGAIQMAEEALKRREKSVSQVTSPSLGLQ